MKTEPFGALLRDKKTGTVAVLVLALTIAMAAGLSPPRVGAQQTNRVGLIVDFGDQYITRCVEFSESEITGYDVLRRAGLDVVVMASGGMGVAVCDINNTSGCPASNCFCKCQGSPCVYWAYQHLVNGSWQYSQLGASSSKARNGDIEGWAWGEGALNSSGAQPPVIPFDQICAPPATDTPVPTDTPIPPTKTPMPTNTPVPPTDTPVPTDTPEPEQEPTSVPTPEAWFRLDENPIDAGSCTMLRWDTSNAQEIYLDGDEVSIIGSREVCPTAPTDYELRVVGLEEEETFRLTLGVTGSAATATSTPQPTAAPASPSPTASPGEATLPPASPTAQAAKATPTAPTSGTEPTTAASPSPTETQGGASAATPAPSPTPAHIAQARPTATAARIAQMEDAEQEPSPPNSGEARSPFFPIRYAVFSLIVGGLLGWLIYIRRFRGERA